MPGRHSDTRGIGVHDRTGIRTRTAGFSREHALFGNVRDSTQHHCPRAAALICMPTKKQRRGALSTEIHARAPNELKITVEAPLRILAVIAALQRDSLPPASLKHIAVR